MGQKYLKMEDQKLGPGLVRKQEDVAKGGRLEPKVNVFKISAKFYCGGAVKKLISLKRITDRGLGQGFQPPEAKGDFLKIFLIFGKNSHFNCTFYGHLKELNF